MVLHVQLSSSLSHTYIYIYFIILWEFRVTFALFELLLASCCQELLYVELSSVESNVEADKICFHEVVVGGVK